MEQLSDASMLKVVKEKLEKRKKKREWIKNRRERKTKELAEAIYRRTEINKQIDQEREVIQMKIVCEKRVTKIQTQTLGFYRKICDFFLG